MKIQIQRDWVNVKKPYNLKSVAQFTNHPTWWMLVYNLFDSGAIEMSIMAAAKEWGIDSVPAYEAIKYPDVIRKYTKIPENEDIIVGIGLGYESDCALNKFRVKKMGIDDACHFIK